MKTLLLTFLFCYFFLSCSADHILESSLHTPRCGDRLLKQQVWPFPPGPSGDGVTWDFSSLVAVEGEDYPLYYYSPTSEDSCLVVGLEHDTRYRYFLCDSAVFLQGYHNRRVEMSFSEPEFYLPFPFYYADTLSRPFRGSGTYFREHALSASGRTFLSVDGRGTLLLPGGDTLSHVLRVKRVRCYDDVGVEGSLLRLETYLWYAAGYRYPVLESVRCVVMKSEDGWEEKEDFSVGFYYPLAGMESLADDPLNAAIRDSLRSDKDIDPGILLRCEVHPNPVDAVSSVRFELSSPALVSIRLCDLVGNVVGVVSLQESLSAGVHERELSLGHLSRGHYIVAIVANEYLKNQVIIKK